MRKTKNKVKQYVDENPIEQILGIGAGVARAGADLAKPVISLDDWDQYLGLADSKEKRKHQTSGDLQEGQELNLKELQENSLGEQKEKREIGAGIDYSREIIQVEERAVSRENQEIDAQLREIMAEIKKLADSSKELQMQFKEVAVEQHTAKPGKYHKTFFSWLLSIIRAARMEVEDSGAWLAAMHSKKKSREYGAMAKKHGTSFSLSNERNVATQVG